MILSFQTVRSGQTLQTQIRLLLVEQSNQGLHCLLFHLHLFDEIPRLPAEVWPLCLNFSLITAKFSSVRKFRKFTVLSSGLRYHFLKDYQYKYGMDSLYIYALMVFQSKDLPFLNDYCVI